ncbi:hypothetical protein TNCV_1416721 [Trichonephila clavipes]|nr:hypothetical protein TNCV_1416721 [Trichonephila clavipes]
MPGWIATICFNAMDSMNTRLTTSSVRTERRQMGPCIGISTFAERDFVHSPGAAITFECATTFRRFQLPIGPGSNPQPWVQKASDKPTTPSSRDK